MCLKNNSEKKGTQTLYLNIKYAVNTFDDILKLGIRLLFDFSFWDGTSMISLFESWSTTTSISTHIPLESMTQRATSVLLFSLVRANILSRKAFNDEFVFGNPNELTASKTASCSLRGKYKIGKNEKYNLSQKELQNNETILKLWIKRVIMIKFSLWLRFDICVKNIIEDIATRKKRNIIFKKFKKILKCM